MADEITLLAGQRQKRESKNARLACNDYLRMGPGRRLSDLRHRYCQMQKNHAPTQSKSTLWAWSSRYNWAARAEEYDARLEDEKNQRAQEIMQSGLSLPYERVVKLKELASFIEDQMYEQGEDGVYHNVWMPDVKVVGYGDNATVVDIEHFNSAIIIQYRETLDDLAKETGGRVNRTDVTSGGQEIVFKLGNVSIDDV